MTTESRSPQLAQHPVMGLATLMRMAFEEVDLQPVGAELIARADADPDDAAALLDLSILLQLKFSPELALSFQARALEVAQRYRLPEKAPVTIRLLAIMAPGDLMTNAPLDFLVEDSDVELEMLYVSDTLPIPADLPEHDVMFVAVGEADHTQGVLRSLQAIVPSWPRPVINRPDKIVWTSREGAAERLKGAEALVMPASVRVPRGTLEQIGYGAQSLAAIPEAGGFPIIIRPTDSHAGHGLEKLESSDALLAYLEKMPANPVFYVSTFVDYRNPDGLFRKYRVVLIDGKPYAAHMGISTHWMIHYLNAGMTESAEKRAEEAAFMGDFDSQFGARHARAFQEITERLGLDYLVVDCGETPDGRLLVFEVDTGAVVHTMDPEAMFPYKKPQMKKVFAAFREMLTRAIARGPRPS